MKKILSLLAFMAVSGLAMAQTSWITITKDDRVSFQVPDSLMDLNMEQVAVYTLSTGDSINYTITIIDFVNFGLESTMIQGMAETDEFEEQFKGGFMGQMEGAELISSTRGKLQERTTYLFELEMGGEDAGAVKSKMFVYSVFVGSKVYSFSFVSDKPQTAEKDKFFGSVKILK